MPDTDDGYIDSSIIKHGNPIEYKPRPFTGELLDNGLLVEEVEYADYLAALDKFRRENKLAEE